MNKAEALKSLDGTKGFFRHWMGSRQRGALKNCINSEEGDYFCELLAKVKKQIEDAPKTYDTEGVECKDKIVHLHYFGGPIDIFVAEKDMGDGTDLIQLQAFGYVNMGDPDCAEWGYVSIQEAIDAGVELDLYWEPKAFKECGQ